MKIAYLEYSNDSKDIEFGKLKEYFEKNKDTINKIYLKELLFSSNELENIDVSLLQNVPIKFNNKLNTGLNNELILWIRERITFEEPSEQLVFQEKKSLFGLNLYMFSANQNNDKRKVGRNNYEHIDNDMTLIQVSLDDMNPEFYSYIFDEIIELGANDVYIEQVIMKKNRPGQILNILVQNEKVSLIKNFIFKETTTLGIRYTPFTVYRLQRKYVKVVTEWGEMTIKLGLYNGEVVQIAPEYEECKQIAKKYNIPLKRIYDNVKKMELNI